MLNDLEDKLYNEKEAAKILKSSRVSLWRWREAGLLAHVRIGEKVLYTKDNLVEFITKHIIARSESKPK